MREIKDYELSEENKQKVANIREEIAKKAKELKRLEKVRLINQKKERNNSGSTLSKSK